MAEIEIDVEGVDHDKIKAHTYDKDGQLVFPNYINTRPTSWDSYRITFAKEATDRNGKAAQVASVMVHFE